MSSQVVCCGHEGSLTLDPLAGGDPKLEGGKGEHVAHVRGDSPTVPTAAVNVTSQAEGAEEAPWPGAAAGPPPRLPVSPLLPVAPPRATGTGTPGLALPGPLPLLALLPSGAAEGIAKEDTGLFSMPLAAAANAATPEGKHDEGRVLQLCMPEATPRGPLPGKQLGNGGPAGEREDSQGGKAAKATEAWQELQGGQPLPTLPVWHNQVPSSTGRPHFQRSATLSSLDTPRAPSATYTTASDSLQGVQLSQAGHRSPSARYRSGSCLGPLSPLSLKLRPISGAMGAPGLSQANVYTEGIRRGGGEGGKGGQVAHAMHHTFSPSGSGSSGHVGGRGGGGGATPSAGASGSGGPRSQSMMTLPLPSTLNRGHGGSGHGQHPSSVSLASPSPPLTDLQRMASFVQLLTGGRSLNDALAEAKAQREERANMGLGTSSGHGRRGLALLIPDAPFFANAAYAAATAATAGAASGGQKIGSRSRNAGGGSSRGRDYHAEASNSNLLSFSTANASATSASSSAANLQSLARMARMQQLGSGGALPTPRAASKGGPGLEPTPELPN